MAQRSEVSVMMGDTVRQWGSRCAYRKVRGVLRAGGVTRLYLEGVEQPLTVAAGARVDVHRTE